MADATQMRAVARAPGTALQIHSVSELEALAQMLFRGGLTPPNVDSPNKVAAIILAGMEVGLPPTQALGSIMLTNGRLTIYGDGAKALVLASGLLVSMKEWVDGEGDDRTGHCMAQRKGDAEVHYKFTIREANQAGLIERARGKDGKGRGPWVSYPDRMLLMRARGFLFRDHFPDVLRGLITFEEAQDFGPEVITVEAKTVATTPERTASQPAAEAPLQLPAVATPEPSTAVPSGPVTAEQLEELAKLRKLVMAAKGIGTDKAAQAQVWEQMLAPFGVTSAKSLTAEQAAEFIAKVGKEHDPFGHPSGGTGGSPT